MASPRVRRIITVCEFDDGTFDAHDTPVGGGIGRFEPASISEADRKVAETFVLSRLQFDPRGQRRNEFE